MARRQVGLSEQDVLTARFGNAAMATSPKLTSLP
jgi:hypothetical protein